jgi:hypothetical protein
VNGDGFADVIVGAPGYDHGETDEGAAFLFWGSASGLVGTDPGSAAAFMESNRFGAGLGRSVSGAGDVNGDGYADVIVGAPEYVIGDELLYEGAAFLFLGSALGLVGSDPSNAASTVRSRQDYSRMGDSVSGAGDVNGDGYADVIIGVPNYDNGEGEEGVALMFLGSSSGLAGADAESAAAVLESNQVDAQMGSSVSAAGDVNRDGYSDVIVGAPHYSNGQNSEGAVFLFLGSASGLVGVDPESAEAVLESDQADARMGDSVSGAGDVNGDGYADIVAGAPLYDGGMTDEGAAILFLGSPTGLLGSNPGSAASVLESSQVDAQMGSNVSGAGDVNGDGYADVIVGASGYDGGEVNEGAVFLFLGSASGLVGTNPDSAAAILESNKSLAEFGVSVSGAGDVNGDSYADVVVGAPFIDNGESGEGATFLFLGSTSGLVGRNPSSASSLLRSNQASSEMGYSVSGVGDVNGDGYADVIVGAAGDPEVTGGAYDNGEPNEGAAFLFLGSASGLAGTAPGNAAAVLESNQAGARLGVSVSGAGDVNGDGYADVIVGAPLYSNGEPSEGAAFLFLGSASGLVGTSPENAAADLESNYESARFGVSVSGAGDVNGDGYADVIVGADGYVNGEFGRGAAFLFLGSESGLIGENPDSAAVTLNADQDGAWMGYSVSGAGDVNGDGYGDVIVGAPAFGSGEYGEGGAFLFLGSASGLVGTDLNTAAAVLESNQINGGMGSSVSGAGDVNGDGYDDVIVGAASVIHGTYRNGHSLEGAAFLFHGSASGLAGRNPESADAVLESNQADAYFGISVSGAGDVNGDGYADVLVGSPGYDMGEEDEGAAILFLGSASGLTGTDPDSAAAVLESNQAFASAGSSVFGAGDVNGDGYADVIVGVLGYDEIESEEGACLVFLGGEGVGVSNPPLLGRGDATRLGAPGISTESNSIRLQYTGLALPSGHASRIRLEYQVKSYGAPWESVPVTVADWVTPPLAGHTFDQLITEIPEANGHQVRYRIRHLSEQYFKPGITPSPNPSAGRWFYPQWATEGPSDFRTSGYRPPTDPGVSVDQSPLRTTDGIVATVVPSTSPAVPPKAIQYEYVWSNGNREVTHVSSMETDVLGASETSKHEIWTCTVRAWDGVQYSHLSASDTAPEVQNTAPAAPSVAIPEVQSTSQNLIAQLSQVAADPDIDPIQYDFDWYVKRTGSGAFALFRDGTRSPSISSQINNSDTEPGDQWYVAVTPHDDEAPGTPASTQSVPTQIVQGGVEPSFIALGLSPTSITLGQSVTASGNVFPTPAGSPNVTFQSTSPGGMVSGVFPEGTVLSGGAYTRTFTPTEASAGRSAWSITASWPGDDTYQSATSAAATFTVAKAQPALTLTVAPDTALLGLANAPDFAVTASLLVPGFPEALQGLLEGRTVALSVVDGENQSQGTVSTVTDATGAAVFHKNDFDAADIDFGTPGVWRFKAAFAGDDNLLSAETADFDETDARLTIKRGAGYAIVVLGRLDANAEGHREHAITTDTIYRTLRARQFAAEDIYYLREYLPGQGETPSGDIGVFGAATETNLAAAFTQVQAKILNSPAPLYLVLVDHGNPELFYMDAANTPGVQETLTPAELDAQLDLLQSALAVNPEAASQEIVIINGSCYSGSFIPALSGANRVVITSTTADNISYRGVDRTPDDGAEIRDGEFFLMELFRDLGAGQTIRAAFAHAAAQTVSYTAPSGNSGGGDSGRAQQALLDDNGDGAGTHGSLSSSAGQDGARSGALTLGLGTNAAGGVSWFTASQPITITASKSLGQNLFAQSLGRPLAADDRAWLEVKRPDAEDELASEDYPDLQRAWSLVGPLDPIAPLGDGDGRLEWSAAALNAVVGFDTPGTYKAYYFLYDGQTGQVASYLVTNIYVAAAGNQAPLPVTPLLPADDSVIETSGSAVQFVWRSTTDPEGDAFTYTLEVSPDADFPEGMTAIASGLEKRYVVYDQAFRAVHGISEPGDGQYYWRVYAVDEFGAASAVTGVRSFTLMNIANPDSASGIAGTVTDAHSGLPIPEAIVYLDEFQVTAGDNGEYQISMLSSGQSYALSASARGYAAAAPEPVRLDAGEFAERPIPLQREAQTVQALAQQLLDGLAEADTNGNGLSLGEARTILAGLGDSEFDPLDSDGNGLLSPAELLEISTGEDVTPPLITITDNTSSANTVDCGGVYTDPGATALDGVDGAVPVDTYGDVNTSIPGEHVIAYVAVDSSGNEATAVRVVTVLAVDCPAIEQPDTAPVITVTPGPDAIDCGAAYTDPRATAVDDVDPAVTVTAIGAVDTARPGAHTIVYTATDTAGNHANPAYRTVTVRDNCPVDPGPDTTPPVITLAGDAETTIDCGSGAYADPGAAAVDNEDGEVAVQQTGAVNTAVPGAYTRFYTATDAAGNLTVAVRTVTVRDNCAVEPGGDVIPPIVTVNGNDSARNTIDCGSGPFNDPGAAVSDETDTDLTPVVLGTVNADVPGTYTLYYYAQDSAGNPAPIVSRTVTVLDNCPEPDLTAPTIVLESDNAETNTVNCGTDFDDPGATAQDERDGTVPFQRYGLVNVNVPGEYVLVYTAEDAAGNQAAPVERRVTVLDNCSGTPEDTRPVIVLNDNVEEANTVDCGSGPYPDPGAAVTHEEDLEAQVAGAVNTDQPGNYALIYTAADSGGNPANPAIRLVTVRDNCTPDEETLPGLADNLLEVFAAGDTNGDNALSFEEAKEMMSTLTHAEFNAMDSDSDGVLTQAELEAVSNGGEGEGEGEGEGGCPANSKTLLEGLRHAAGDLFLLGMALLGLLGWRGGHGRS